jgi:DNA (cytosine-5)-methyltransferase 1
MNRTIHIDLFSGAGGFHEGLIRAGFAFTHHYYSEIDRHAIANYRYNYKDAEYIGSVTDVRNIIRTIDRKPEDRVILTFGSPCQDFSLAGKREGLEGSKSSLIKFALFLIKWIRPDVYIWENVKGAYSSNGGADYWAIIKAFANIDGYGFEQQLLNTSWILPQNRERIYLVGHLGDRSKPGVFPIGETSDIHNRPRETEKEIHADNRVAITQQARQYSSWCGDFIKVRTNTSQGFEIASEGDSINFSNPNSKTRCGRVGKGVAQTLDTQANQGVITHYGHKNKPPQKHDIVPTLKAESHGHEPMVIEKSNIRRLTEIEVEILQGFCPNHTRFGIYETKNGLETKPIPKTQRYKLMGNAVTCDIVQLIGERIELL